MSPIHFYLFYLYFITKRQHLKSLLISLYLIIIDKIIEKTQNCLLKPIKTIFSYQISEFSFQTEVILIILSFY